MADVTWYGDSMYLDNTEFGITFWLNDLEIDTYIRLNPENWLHQSSKGVTLRASMPRQMRQNNPCRSL